MIDNPEMSRVVFELPTRDLPDLMVELGDFVATHSLAIEFSDAQEATEPSLTIETEEASPKYNTDLVKEVLDKETGDKIAIITEHQIDQLEVGSKYLSGVPVRTLLSLVRAKNTGYGYDVTAGYVYTDRDGDTVTRGLIVKKLPELVQRLSSGQMKVYCIGPLSIKLLRDLVEELYRPQDAE